jgi:hypothetical protein
MGIQQNEIFNPERVRRLATQPGATRFALAPGFHIPRRWRSDLYVINCWWRSDLYLTD